MPGPYRYPRRIAVCRICGHTGQIYRAGACRPCDTRLHRDAHKPAGPVNPVGARPGTPVAPMRCPCGLTGGVIYGGMCRKCWGLAQLPPPYDPVYAEDRA